MKQPLPIALGWLAVFTSAFCFYFSTVVIRWSRTEVAIDPAYFAFFRFITGFMLVCLILALTGQRPRPRKYHLLVGRAVSNSVAVYCFYMAVTHASVAEANILNMTYPVFVALLSWIMLRQQRDGPALMMVAVAFVGIWMIVAPGGIRFKAGSLWGLASGLSASGAILYLNVSRRYHDVNTVLFFMFGLGAMFTFAAFHRRFFWPDLRAFHYLALCGAFGIAGQFLLTLGFRYVTAVEGSVISSMRIFLAALLGPLMVAEEPLNATGWLGAILLFTANAALALRRARTSAGAPPR